MESRLAEEEKAIYESLRNMYNHMIASSGRHINLKEGDDFAEEMVAMCGEEAGLLREAAGDRRVTEGRLLLIAKVCQLLGALEGRGGGRWAE